MSEEDQVSLMVKLSVFVGIFAVRLLDGIPWVWGNLAIYVMSYYEARVVKSSEGVTDWLMTVDVIAFNTGLIIGKPICKKFGTLRTLLTSILVYNAGILLSFYTLQHSMALFCVTFGCLTGVSGGITEAVQLTIIVRWTKRYQGMAVSSIPSSNILGAVAVNFMLTFFINPHNEKPKLLDQRMKTFTQSDVVDRVPYAFIMLGMVSLVLNIFGFLLIREQPGSDNIFIEMVRNKCKRLAQENIPLTATMSPVPSSTSTPQDDSAKHRNQNGGACDVNTRNNDITPKQAFKRREFYVLWVLVAIQTYAFFVLNTYYKEFGLLYIMDDHFLTAVIMVKCLCTPVCTWIAGFAVDKFGVKITMTITSSLFCVVASLFYLTPVDKWLYLCSCVAYGCSLFTLFCLTSACCVKVFGETHFTTIFGLVHTSSYVVTCLLPPICGWIILTFGWFVLFISVGALAFFNVLQLVWGLPEKTLIECDRLPPASYE